MWSKIPNLHKLSNINGLWNWGVNQNILPRAYLFDGVNDYIAWDTTIGRTGTDMNVSGNVTTWSDSDWSYIQFTWATSWLLTWTALSHVSLASAFTVTFYFKTWADVATTQRIFNNTVSSSNRIAFAIISWDLRCWIYNWTSYVWKKSVGVSANTLYKCTYTWDGSSVWKLYVNNVEETTVPAWDPTGTATVSVFIGWPTANFFTGYVYFVRTYNKVLSTTERDAEYANWMTSLVWYSWTDIPISSLLFECRPENLQYNTQYITNPKDLSNATRTKGTGTTVTADFSVAPDWTTTADQVAWTGTDIATSRCDRTFTTLGWSTLASKTFIVKAFVKVAAGTALFRLRCSHNWVADYYSSNQTATTVWQEFTFTQAFTSSSSWTGITAGLVLESWLSAATLEVRNVRLFLTNETLRDESPNIGNFIGRKTNKVFSCWYKPNADFASSANAWVLLISPRCYIQDRNSNHTLQIVSDRRPSTAISQTILWASYRSRTHVIWCFYWGWSGWDTKLYVNWSLVDSDSYSVDAPSSSYVTTIQSAIKSSTYYSWHIRDARIYTWTIDDTDATNMYNWWEPATAVKYLQWKPNSAEWWTTARDRSWNLRTWTLTWGVTRTAVPSS